MTIRTGPPSDPSLATRLGRELEGEVLFDSFSRGLYSTDASIYQVEPVGVVMPKTTTDVFRALEIANEVSLPVTPRGAGTSQSGQAIGEGLVMDTSKYLTEIGELDQQVAQLGLRQLLHRGLGLVGPGLCIGAGRIQRAVLVEQGQRVL